MTSSEGWCSHDAEDCAFDLLISCPEGLNRSQLQVEFESAYDRAAHPDQELEGAIIKVIWEEQLAANRSLFNATKFRYGGYKLIYAEEQLGVGNPCLCLGLTDYKTFVGTNLGSNWKMFLRKGDDIDKCKHTASPLGNGAVVETMDNSILVLKRSQNVGEFPGHFVFPGGHSEPEEIGVHGHLNGGLLHEKAILNGRIAEEMFNGIIREVVEETGVPPSFLSDPLFIGISRRRLNARPTAFFFVKCALCSSEVLQYYKDAEHKFESTELIAIPMEDLMLAAKHMPGCHQGGAALYRLMEDARLARDANSGPGELPMHKAKHQQCTTGF